MRCVILALLLLGFSLAGCMSHGNRPPRTSDPKDEQSATSARAKHSRWREMTWAEYYSDVNERAWRNNADVIWITPPRVVRRPVATASAPPPCGR